MRFSRKKPRNSRDMAFRFLPALIGSFAAASKRSRSAASNRPAISPSRSTLSAAPPEYRRPSHLRRWQQESLASHGSSPRSSLWSCSPPAFGSSLVQRHLPADIPRSHFGLLTFVRLDSLPDAPWSTPLPSTASR